MLNMRPMTESQHTALDILDSHEEGGAAVVGWDTAVAGPLITLDRHGSTGPFVAITPRGKIIPDRKGPLA